MCGLKVREKFLSREREVGLAFFGYGEMIASATMDFHMARQYAREFL
jgi:hypothetical protein